ncbi:MAG: histidinol-phosphate transaminase [Sphingobacteriales bacterium]|jgi:histidinol-phosphate aminotransferase
MSFDLTILIRPNIRKLVPYSSARNEFKGSASIFLDANENSLGSPLIKWYNRYPDPMQWELKKKLSTIKGIAPEHIFIGNGSDEPIDLLYRAFCEPGMDNVIVCPPTYGMYEVSANINNVTLKKVPLTAQFQLDLEGLEEAIDSHTRIIWICSPNNPTGNALYREDIEIILNNFSGLVVIDEAYVNFSRYRSFIPDLADYPNLVVMQTLSKAWGLAALRIGMAFASKEIIEVFNKIKPPYNISEPTQELALQALDSMEDVNEMIRILVAERDQLALDLMKLPQVIQVYPSDANFLLVKMKDAKGLYLFLTEKGIVVRDRSSVMLCEDCLRITIGTPEENKRLLEAVASF